MGGDSVDAPGVGSGGSDVSVVGSDACGGGGGERGRENSGDDAPCIVAVAATDEASVVVGHAFCPCRYTDAGHGVVAPSAPLAGHSLLILSAPPHRGRSSSSSVLPSPTVDRRAPVACAPDPTPPSIFDLPLSGFLHPRSFVRYSPRQRWSSVNRVELNGASSSSRLNSSFSGDFSPPRSGSTQQTCQVKFPPKNLRGFSRIPMPSGKPGHAPVREAVFWSDKMNEYLIDSLLHQEAIGNRGEGRFFSVAYDNIINGIGDRFGVAVDRSNIKNRLKYIKESFNECKNLLGEDSRIKWSAVSKRFNAEPHVWRELIERKPEAKKWMTKTIDHYDRLTELFGKDREKRPPVDNFKSVPKKKARKELTQEHKSTPSNGSDFTVASGSDTTVNGSEAPNEAVIKNIVSGELDLSEACRTESGIIAIPVCANAYGKGLPYAPENWPCPGDEWYWRVGNRTNSGGYWADRYLTPPSRFRVATGKKTSFASRLQVEEFIRREFPSIDPSTFFSMFIWKIPAKGQGLKKGTQQLRLLEPEPEPVVTVPAGPCKARNNLCNLEREGFIESSPAQDCNICCAMPGFCRQCCCILCRKTVDYSFGGYSYIKCEAVVQENYICGHIAHLDCALRCYMAGTVGGKIGLDVQYICRICDNRTDLMMHVEKLMETCQSLESRDEIEPILNLGLCLLRGSSQTKANNMENLMASAMAKLTCGVEIAEIWKTGNDKGRATSNAGESSSLANGVTILGAQQVPDEAVHQGHLDPIDSFVDNALQFPEEAVRQGHLDPLELETAAENLPAYITGDHKAMSAKFENDIGLALQELKKSQEAEFRLAEEKLYSQKDCILNVYRQLESERAELADLGASSHNYNYHTMLSNVLNHVGQAKREEEKFKAMLKVADGFGKTPKSVTQELFGLSAATDSKSN